MSERILAFLLHFYPPGFREKYFEEAMLLYRDRYRFETGLYRRARLWCDLLADLVTGLPKAWQTSYLVVATPSESPNMNHIPSFRLLHKEPLRPAVIVVGGLLSLGAVCTLTFVLHTLSLHPIHPHKMSSIESVMHRVNQPAFPEAGNRTLPIDLAADSITSLANQARAHISTNTRGVDVARLHAGNAIRARQAHNLPSVRSRHAEQHQRMLDSSLGSDGRVLSTQKRESALIPVRVTSRSNGKNVAMAGDQNSGSVSPEQARPEDVTGAMMQAENEGSAWPIARETYVSLPLAEVQLLLSGDCATIRASRELPDQIKNAFATITHTKSFALADPGAEFNATDIEPGVPERRQLLAGRCQDRWFIEYEHGGTAKSVALMVLRSNPDKSVTFVWGRQLKNSAKDLAQLRVALANAAFWDAPHSW